MPLTTDPDDPRLKRGEGEGQNEVYLVLSEEERAKDFVRPYRDSYTHVGPLGPKYPLSDLTDDQKRLFGEKYAKYEAYPESEAPAVGRFWTQEQLDNVASGCGTSTKMGRELSETYARSPHFYGFTFCVFCNKHLPVEEFIWDLDGERVGS